MRFNARYLCSFVFSNLLILLGFVRRAKKKLLSGEYIIPLYFHNPSRKEFESCVKWLAANKFNFIDAAALDKIISAELPFPKGSVLLTADDGWKCNEKNIAAIADKYHIPVTIFVSTKPVENGVYWWSYIRAAEKQNLNGYSVNFLKTVPNEERETIVEEIKKQVPLAREAMTIEQIRRISRSKNITIGSHTDSHPILPNCNKEQVYKELHISKEKLEAWTGKDVSFFAYPNGDYDETNTAILKALDYKLAFTTEPRYLTPQTLHHQYKLPRFALWENAPLAENICRMVGIWEPIMNKLSGLTKVKKRQPNISFKFN